MTTNSNKTASLLATRDDVGPFELGQIEFQVDCMTRRGRSRAEIHRALASVWGFERADDWLADRMADDSRKAAR